MVQVDTVVWWFRRANDSSLMKRCNASKWGLLENYRKGGGTRAAVMIGPWHVGWRRWVATGLGFCYYRDWESEPAPPPVGCKLDATEKPANSSDYSYMLADVLCKVTSLTPGYFTTTRSGEPKFVECRGRCPKDKWLVLKLSLLNGGTVYF
jgi:hypothetical protein